MAFMTIDGNAEYVQSRSARIQVRNVGHIARAFAGNLRAVSRDQYADAMGWQTLPLNFMTAGAFLALGDGLPHNISGDLFGGAAIPAVVEIVEWEYVGAAGQLIVVTYNLRFTTTL